MKVKRHFQKQKITIYIYLRVRVTVFSPSLYNQHIGCLVFNGKRGKFASPTVKASQSSTCYKTLVIVDQERNKSVPKWLHRRKHFKEYSAIKKKSEWPSFLT